jgi:hypothetical protein
MAELLCCICEVIPKLDCEGCCECPNVKCPEVDGLLCCCVDDPIHCCTSCKDPCQERCPSMNCYQECVNCGCPNRLAHCCSCKCSAVFGGYCCVWNTNWDCRSGVCINWGYNHNTQLPIGSLCDCDLGAGDAPCAYAACVWVFCMPCALAGLLAKREDPYRPAHCGHFFSALLCCPLALCFAREGRRRRYNVFRQDCQPCFDCCAVATACPCMLCQMCRASERFEWDPCTAIPSESERRRNDVAPAGFVVGFPVGNDNGSGGYPGSGTYPGNDGSYGGSGAYPNSGNEQPRSEAYPIGYVPDSQKSNTHSRPMV